MRLKQAILNVMNADTLRQVVEEYEFEVADRRRIDLLSDAISRAKRTRPNELLEYLNEQEVKRVCEFMEIDLTGRRRTLIERLLGDVEQPEKPKPFSLVPPGQKIEEKPGVKKEFVEAALPLPVTIPKPVPTPEGSFEFEPIKGYPMLHWRGKRPFTSTQYYPAQLKEVYGEEVNGWRNKIYWGDNLQVMSHLLKIFRGAINLIYLDPPFDSKIEYKKKIKFGNEEIGTGYSCFEDKQYTDIWVNDEFLQFMYERLIIMRELLDESGVLCLHCDWHKSHYLRCILDEIFGGTAFRNEIIWYYYNKMQGNINRFASNHDNLLVYSKSDNFKFNKLREKRDKPVKQIKRVWDKNTQSLVNAKDDEGNIIYIDSTHKTVDDVWRLSMLQPADRIELVGYPTQKPEALLERVILAFSKPGDIVFDGFIGAGVTPLVAEKVGRKFIGVDINKCSVDITIKSVAKLGEMILNDDNYVPYIKNGIYDNERVADLEDDDIGNNDKNVDSIIYYTGFEVHHVNQYDIFRNPVEAKDLITEAFEIQKLERNSVFDGEKDGRMVKILPINRITTRADLNDLIAGMDYKASEERQAMRHHQPVEKILLVCMGHEPDIKAHLQKEVPYKLDIEIVDILRDKANLEFKRESVAKVSIKGAELVIDRFYPMNLLQKLSLQKESVTEWRELVESVMVDWNYDGAVLQPAMVDIPGKNVLVKGRYKIPDDAGNIRVKITDLLSESLEVVVAHG